VVLVRDLNHMLLKAEQGIFLKMLRISAYSLQECGDFSLRVVACRIHFFLFS